MTLSTTKNKAFKAAQLFLLKSFITALGQKCPQCSVRAGHKHRPECPLRRFGDVWE
jgi:hypothetical protein